MSLSLYQFVDSNIIDMRGTDNTVEFKGLGFEDLACFMRLKMGIFGGLLCTRWWKFCFCVFLYQWRIFPIPCNSLLLWGFTITLRLTTLGWTPLDEWSARRKDLYLTTHTRDKQSCPRRVRSDNRRKLATADPHLWPHGYFFFPTVGKFWWPGEDLAFRTACAPCC